MEEQKQIENDLISEEEDEIDDEPQQEGKWIYLDIMSVKNQPQKSNEFIKTKKETIISKSCSIKNTKNILTARVVFGPKSILRTDLSTIRIDLFSIICDHVTLKPPQNNNKEFTVITIGRYCIIGSHSIVKANIIENCVRIGKNCVIQDKVVIGENSIILDNSIVPANVKIPPNCIFGGQPAQFLGFSPITTQQDHIIEAIHYYEQAYKNFKQIIYNEQ